MFYREQGKYSPCVNYEIVNTPILMEFRDVEINSSFIYDGCLFIKIDTVCSNPNALCVNHNQPDLGVVFAKFFSLEDVWVTDVNFRGYTKCSTSTVPAQDQTNQLKLLTYSPLP